MKSGFSRESPATRTPLIQRPGMLFARSEKAAELIYAKICGASPSYSRFPSPVPEWFIETFSSLGTPLRNLYLHHPVIFAPTTCAAGNFAGRSIPSHIQESWATKLGRRTLGHTVAPPTTGPVWPLIPSLTSSTFPPAQLRQTGMAP